MTNGRLFISFLSCAQGAEVWPGKRQRPKVSHPTTPQMRGSKSPRLEDRVKTLPQARKAKGRLKPKKVKQGNLRRRGSKHSKVRNPTKGEATTGPRAMQLSIMLLKPKVSLPDKILSEVLPPVFPNDVFARM